MEKKMTRNMINILLCLSMGFHCAPSVIAEEYETDPSSEDSAEVIEETSEIQKAIEETIDTDPEDEQTENTLPEIEETAEPDEAEVFEDTTAETFTIENGVLTAYNGTDTVVDIPETVTEIAEKVFSGNTVMQTVHFPSMLTIIGNYAFENCTGLTGDLELTDSITSIGQGAFKGCTGLKGTLKLSKNLKSIPEDAFRNVPFTGPLSIPEGIETIGIRAFDGNKFSGDVVFPDSLKDISMYAFTLTSDLGNITFGSGLERFAYYAFTKNEGTEEITFTSAAPPDIRSEYSSSNTDRFKDFLGFFPNVKRINVPKESYAAYLEKYGSYLTEGVEIVQMGYTIENLRVTELTGNCVTLQWDPVDSEDLIKYQVFRGTAEDELKLIGETETALFRDEDFEIDRTYTYTIKAVFGNENDQAEGSLTVTVSSVSVRRIRTKYEEDGIPQIRLHHSKLYADVYDLNISDHSETDPYGQFWYLGTAGERILISEPATVPYSQSSDGRIYAAEWDVSGLPVGNYTVGFTYTSANGETAEFSTEVHYGNEVPAKLAGVSAFGDTNSIVLNWSIAHEISTNRYHVYRSADGENFQLAKVFNSRDTLSWTDNSTEPGKQYFYYVCGVNRYGEEGIRSDIASAVPLSDTAAPQIVKITPADFTSISGTVSLYAQAEDNVGIARTELYYSSEQDDSGNDVWVFLSASDRSFIKADLDTLQFPDGRLKIKAVAYDNAQPYTDRDHHGNVSDPLIRNYMVDNTGPSQVKDITWQSTASVVTLMWPDIEDQDRKFYRVEQRNDDGSYSAVKDVYALGINISGLESDTEYVFRVVCYDQSGNRGTESENVITRTTADTTSPVISAISPAPGNYKGTLAVKVKASDDKSISRIVVQTSRNAETWNDYQTFAFKGTNKEETASFTLNLDALSDGYLYVRGIAYDAMNNQSDDSASAPFVQYCIDHTAPGVPLNVTADTAKHAIEIRWESPGDNDITGFKLYRSEDGTHFELLKGDIASLNWFDRSVELGKVYSYKAAAKDSAGNVSELSDSVEASIPNDTEAPVIESIKPAEGSLLGADRYTISVLASDNFRLGSVRGTYRKEGSDEVFDLFNEEITDTYYTVVNGKVNIGLFDDQDQIIVDVTARDTAGLTVTGQYHYTVDLTAPNVLNLSAEYLSDHISLSWEGEQEEDLQGYRIYRSDDGGKYKHIYSLAGNDSGSYTYHDYAVSNTVSYQYQIEAVDTAGNTSSVFSGAAYLSGESVVSASLIYTPVQEVGADYIYDASECVSSADLVSYTFDFGDGTKVTQASPSAVHQYAATGAYTVTLTIRDETGTEDVITKTVTVKEAVLFGTLKVHVTDSCGNPLSSASVYFDLAHENGINAGTDRNGDVVFHAEAGLYEIGAYIADKVPVKKTVAISAGKETAVVLRMSDMPLVTGSFNITRMTLDEIKAAGIDVSDPANQQIIKYDFRIMYGDEAPINCTVYGDPDQEVHETFHTGGTGSGANISLSYNPKTKILSILNIPAQSSWLKEFFNVRLHIFNNASSEFVIIDNTASLTLPEGLTLMKTEVTEGDPSALRGQEQLTYSFVVRGDTQGEYTISADYSGTLKPFDSYVTAHFDSQEKIRVHGESAVEVGGNFSPVIQDGTAYFELYIKNTSSADIYYPNTSPIFNWAAWMQKEAEENYKVVSVKEPELLSARIVSSSGVTQNLETDYEPEMLAPGESFIRKYALYGLTDIDETFYINLVKSTASNLDGYGGIVNINILQEEIDYSSDEQKIERIFNDDTYFSLYDYFMTNGNFYSSVYVDGTTGLINELNDNTYIASQLLSGDFEMFTNDQLEGYVRDLVYGYLQSEQCQKDSYKIFETDTLNLASKMIGKIKSLLPGKEDDDATLSYINEVTDYLGSADGARGLVDAFDKDGNAGVLHYLFAVTADFVAKYGSDKLEKMKDKISLLPYDAICSESVSDSLDFLSKSASLGKEFMGLMNTSNEYSIKMTAIHAQRESVLKYLDKKISYLESHPQPNGQRVLDAFKSVRNEAAADYDEYMSSFTHEACLIAGKHGVKALTKKVIPDILKAADKAAAEKLQGSAFIPKNLTATTASRAAVFTAGFTLAKTTFDVLYGFLGTKDYVDLRRNMNVNCAAINSQMFDIKSMVVSDPEGAWSSLQELIRLRIETETAYFLCLEKTEQDQKFLNNYNELNGTAYETIEKFLRDYIGEMQKKSDQLASEIVDQKPGGLVRPEAPRVSIDFTAETTVESFGEEFEYSFDNISWTSCTGSPIALSPERFSKILYVRTKASGANLEGYSAVLFIPAKNTAHINCKAVWNNGMLYLTNLNNGSYNVGSFGAVTVENGPREIKSLPADHVEQITLQKFTGADSFSGYASSIVVMEPTDIADYDLQAYLAQTGFSYDGTEKKPELKFRGSIPDDLTFEASYTNNVSAGTAEAVFTGTGLYTGRITRQFVIVEPADIIKPKKLTLNQKDIKLTVWSEASEDQLSTFTLEPVFTPTDTNVRNLTWTSSDPETAEVVNGTVTALSAGKTVITAETENGIKAVCKVTVNHGEGLSSDGLYYDSKGKPATGWKTVTVKGNEEIVYLTKGKPAVGWKKISKKYYCFTDEGFLMTGWVNNRTSWLDTNPEPKKNKGLMKGWQELDGNWYYFDANGIKVTGLAKISNQYYYFSESADPELSGIMQTGWQNIGGTACYFAQNAKNKHPFRQSGWLDCPDPETGETFRYYFNPVTGAVLTGLVKISGKLYYFDENGHLSEEAFPGSDYSVNAKGKLADAAGKLAEGLIELNGNTYFFKKGVMQTGWQKIVDETGKAVYYFFNPDGTMEKGKTGGDIISDGKKTWFIEESGVRSGETGLVQDSEGYTYAIKNGQILYGQQKVQISSGDQVVSHDYWFDTVTGRMCTNVLRTVKGKWYFYGADGIRSTEPLPVEINGDDYLLNQNGKVTDLNGSLLNMTGPVWIRYTVSDAEGETSDVFELFYLKKGVLSVKWQSYKVTVPASGSQKKTSKTYKFYCDPETGILQRGMKTIAKKQYCFSERDKADQPVGSVITGFFKLRSSNHHTYTYWADKNGALAKGWVLIDKIWYCFDSVDGHLTEIKN
ncbi:MAG: leucine-rich repeat protein [Solobacterium sp.]|nr:leucine-rich repeat protein [Solobacterium sp.]